MRRKQIIGGLKVRRIPTELRKLEKNLISFGEAEGGERGERALVAISHCMSLQTAGQESNRTTVFWWSVHSMLGNDFDIFWWVIYLSAKINFDLMPGILWRCVEICLLTGLGVTLGGCHSRVSLQALLVSFPNKPMRVPATSTAKKVRL